MLDIKPFVPEFDTREVDRIGWLEKKAANVNKIVDDGRFSRQGTPAKDEKRADD